MVRPGLLGVAAASWRPSGLKLSALMGWDSSQASTASSCPGGVAAEPAELHTMLPDVLLNIQMPPISHPHVLRLSEVLAQAASVADHMIQAAEPSSRFVR